MAECPRNCKVHTHYFDEAQLGGVAVVIRERELNWLCETRPETAGRAAPPQRFVVWTCAVDPSICARELRSMR